MSGVNEKIPVVFVRRVGCVGCAAMVQTSSSHVLEWETERTNVAKVVHPTYVLGL